MPNKRKRIQNSHYKARYSSHFAKLEAKKEKRAQKKAERRKQTDCKITECQKCKKKVKINNYGKTIDIKKNDNVHQAVSALELYLCASCRGGRAITPKKKKSNAEGRKQVEEKKHEHKRVR